MSKCIRTKACLGVLGSIGNAGPVRTICIVSSKVFEICGVWVYIYMKILWIGMEMGTTYILICKIF